MSFTYRQLADLLSDVKPGFACGEEDPDGIFQVRMNNVTREGRLDLAKRRFVPASNRAIKSTLLEAGDVLFNATNSPDLVGKTVLFPGLEDPAVFSNHFLRLRVESHELTPDYLARWLQSKFDEGVFRSMCRQWVNQATVSKDALLSLKVPVPSLTDQKRITKALDDVDALRSKRREAISLVSVLAQSVFVSMFGEPGTNPRGLREMTVSDIAEKVTDGEHLTPRREKEGIKLLSARNVRDGHLDFNNVDYVGAEEYQRIAKRCDPRRGDVLVSCSGTIGRVSTVTTDEPFALVRSVALIRPRREVALADYLAQYLQSPAMKAHMVRQANSSSQANLFQNQIKKIPVLVPDIESQKEFCQRLSELSALESVHRTQLAELDALFASIRYRAFQGELFEPVSV